jgi:hypothetical protein
VEVYNSMMDRFNEFRNEPLTSPVIPVGLPALNC